MACGSLAVSTARYLSQLTGEQFVAVMEKLTKNHPNPGNWLGTPSTYYENTYTTAKIYLTPTTGTTFRHITTVYPAETDPAKRTSTSVTVTHELPSRRYSKPSAAQTALEDEFQTMSKAQTMLAMLANLQQAGKLTSMRQVNGATVITMNVED